jgi:CDP-diacylglycerol---glycerol-3-phosphate 3-phosphatidyltransferase
MLLLARFTTLSNVLTLLRAPLALLFLYDAPAVRLCSVFFAMLSDGLDGYVARKFKTVSRFGTILDPIMDRFFVVFALSVLLMEAKLQTWQVFAMLSRDIVFMVFAAFVSVFGNFQKCEPTATFWGKITTFSQFLMLLGLIFGYSFSFFVYFAFIAVGVLLFKELYTLYYRE